MNRKIGVISSIVNLLAVLEFWCAYFCPVTILSFLYFQSKKEHVNEATY